MPLMSQPSASDCSGEPPGCCHKSTNATQIALARRAFLKTLGLGAAGLAGARAPAIIAGPFEPRDVLDHHVPADKKLDPNWVKGLRDRGERTWYSGPELATIGMPVGGICAGQLYLSGEGRLIYWDLFNQNFNSGYGQINYKPGRRPTEAVHGGRFQPALDLDQGFAIRVATDGRTQVRRLDATGFSKIRFCGEYPIAEVQFADDSLPVTVRLEAFSPLIPLNSADSALPVTLLNYTVTNHSHAPARVGLAGWLENRICPYSADRFVGRTVRRNHAWSGDGTMALTCSMPARPPADMPVVRPPVVFADFEAGDYGEWKVEGDAFGTAPADGTLPNQQPVGGFSGQRLVNSYLGGDDRLQGRLVSPAFVIDRPWLSFLIGGGNHADRTCIHLVIGDQVVHTATGRNDERLVPHNWAVREWIGQTARIEIVDQESGPWGHINIDQIEFRDEPMGADPADLHQMPDHGTMALAVFGKNQAWVRTAWKAGPLVQSLFAPNPESEPVERPIDDRLHGAVGRELELAPGESATVTFALSWCFPNLHQSDRWVGQRYAERFNGASDVIHYLELHLDRLTEQTRLWHRTFYDSTIPRWLLDRIGSTVSILASNTCQWWRNGRFWAWEGVGCCHGTCGHVWNYAHAPARLFPDLERSVREMQDFAPGIGFNADNGSIGFRGEGWALWAGDAQGGYILKALREHQMSPDDAFLQRNWPQIRKAVEFLIAEDGDDDGLIEGRQHQTYDQDYFGPNTFVGALYLGALRAAEELATEMGDTAFAARCRRIFEAGSQHSVKRLFNGEYFVQEVDAAQHPEWQYADGCLADQLFGQCWAHQVGLGYLYPEETVRTALQSIWKYCWAPDIAPQNRVHPPERWFAYEGEAGLFTCTWPNSRHGGPRSTRYRDEIWTGIEYQVASHMVCEGMLNEALVICRAIHDRYHPLRRNPWNEIECGDHYARAMASWGVLTAMAGLTTHGPLGKFGFAPRLDSDHFRSLFNTATAWGSIEQRRVSANQTNRVEVQWGSLSLNELTVELPANARLVQSRLMLDDVSVPAAVEVTQRRVHLRPVQPLTARAGQRIEIQVDYQSPAPSNP
jgi:non-lysosomal glucosylceramidase